MASNNQKINWTLPQAHAITMAEPALRIRERLNKRGLGWAAAVAYVFISYLLILLPLKFLVPQLPHYRYVEDALGAAAGAYPYVATLGVIAAFAAIGRRRVLADPRGFRIPPSGAFAFVYGAGNAGRILFNSWDWPWLAIMRPLTEEIVQVGRDVMKHKWLRYVVLVLGLLVLAPVALLLFAPEVLQQLLPEASFNPDDRGHAVIWMFYALAMGNIAIAGPALPIVLRWLPQLLTLGSFFDLVIGYSSVEGWAAGAVFAIFDSSHDMALVAPMLAALRINLIVTLMVVLCGIILGTLPRTLERHAQKTPFEMFDEYGVDQAFAYFKQRRREQSNQLIVLGVAISLIAITMLVLVGESDLPTLIFGIAMAVITVLYRRVFAELSPEILMHPNPLFARAKLRKMFDRWDRFYSAIQQEEQNRQSLVGPNSGGSTSVGIK